MLKSQRDLAVRIMDELSRVLPEWVWLNDVSFEAKNRPDPRAMPFPIT